MLQRSIGNVNHRLQKSSLPLKEGSYTKLPELDERRLGTPGLGNPQTRIHKLIQAHALLGTRVQFKHIQRRSRGGWGGKGAPRGLSAPFGLRVPFCWAPSMVSRQTLKTKQNKTCKPSSPSVVRSVLNTLLEPISFCNKLMIFMDEMVGWHHRFDGLEFE